MLLGCMGITQIIGVGHIARDDAFQICNIVCLSGPILHISKSFTLETESIASIGNILASYPLR